MGKQQKTQKDTKQPKNEKIVEQSKIGVINKKSSKGGTEENTKIPVRQSNRIQNLVQKNYADIPDIEINNDVTSTDSSKRTTSSKKKTEQAPKQIKTATSSKKKIEEPEPFFKKNDSMDTVKKNLQILDTYKDFGRNASDDVHEVLGTQKPPNPSRIAVDIDKKYLPELGYKTITLLRSVITVHELLGKLFDKNKKKTGTTQKEIVLERAGHNNLFKKYCKCCGDYKESRCEIDCHSVTADIQKTVDEKVKTDEILKKPKLNTNVKVNRICKILKESLPKESSSCGSTKSNTTANIPVSSDSSSTVEEENPDKYCNLYKEFYSLANDYDEKQVPLTEYSTKKKTECRERIEGFRTYPDININTTKADGLLVIDNVKLCMENKKCYEVKARKKQNQNPSSIKKYPVTCKYYESSIKYDIDEITEKNIELDDNITKIPGPDKILNDIIKKPLKAIETTTENINKIFNLNYKDYKDSEDKRKKYIKCLFDFKRLGDLQLIKVAEESKLPFVTGDRLAAIIANRSYGITSLYIDNNNAELYEKQEDKYTRKKYTVVDTIKFLSQEISIRLDDEAKKHIKDRIPDYYWKSLHEHLVDNMKNGIYVDPEETGTDEYEDDEDLIWM
jgi:hypothetical protein